MKLTMLGTGNATAIHCYNTCFTLSNEKGYFLVDAGGGNQILKILDEEKIELSDIHDIFVTHGHTDHLLGIIWMIRMIGTKIYRGFYEGDLRIFCHKELEEIVRNICNLTIWGNVTRQFDQRIHFINIEDEKEQKILGCQVKFFDIQSTKMKQFGFFMTTPDGSSLVCCGDEPLREDTEKFARECDWLLHEAFCMYEDREYFKPYEKHHSTVKDACEMAEHLGVKNLILYHTEDKNMAERKERYLAEGTQFYSGNLFVPYDREVFEIV